MSNHQKADCGSSDWYSRSHNLTGRPADSTIKTLMKWNIQVCNDIHLSSDQRDILEQASVLIPA